MAFLFERLAANGRDDIDLRQAVLDQLDWLVGSREWLAEQSGQALIDIVMPEPPGLAANGTDLARYAQRLRRLIALHEPRLRNMQLRLEPTGRAMSPFRVVVSGNLATDGPEQMLYFERDAGPR
ncbi:hypothetical protein FNU76_20245 [Chitinimonas arctica]|uniref:Type VI secretion system baseplate subunit TssE n=1 Tax=Chitinimonas arctica TaxID=2594795 RepID=A0A516SK20_9NEIS|nr:hypothetical protein [Chitinimonas arctica]QDQ28500.1 hypothetical protein FNU76_20245 [Chitinimonas arctica]